MPSRNGNFYKFHLNFCENFPDFLTIYAQFSSFFLPTIANYLKFPYLAFYKIKELKEHIDKYQSQTEYSKVDDASDEETEKNEYDLAQ